jgi:hypothetical protein
MKSDKIITPFGRVDSETKLAEGITLYGTPEHGGIYLSKEQNKKVPRNLRTLDGYYEEDVEWVVVANVFPNVFGEEDVETARRILKEEPDTIFCGNHFDAKVVPWINMINAYEGLETVGSCGGHKHPEGEDQVKENEFYVQFRFDTPDEGPNEDGWWALRDIMRYITECEFNKGESLVIEFKMTIFGNPFFVLKGKNVRFEDLYGETDAE